MELKHDSYGETLGFFSDSDHDYHRSSSGYLDVDVVSVHDPADDGRMVCQVPGCGKDLTNLKEYHLRYRICEVHIRLSQVWVWGGGATTKKSAGGCMAFGRLAGLGGAAAMANRQGSRYWLYCRHYCLSVCLLFIVFLSAYCAHPGTHLLVQTKFKWIDEVISFPVLPSPPNQLHTAVACVVLCFAGAQGGAPAALLPGMW